MTVNRTDPIVTYLWKMGWVADGTIAHHYNVQPGDTITYYVGGLSTAGQQFATAAFAMWHDITGINFTEVSTAGAATVTFENTNAGAYGGSSYYTSGSQAGISVSGSVNISSNWISGDTDGSGNAVLDTYSFQTYIHEIGHVLGLSHPGAYDGNASFPADAAFPNDSWQATIMSYFDQVENTNTTGADGTTAASYAYVLTPQIADILAIQALYGITVADAGTRTGDTTYGYNSNAGGVLDDLTSFTNNVSLTIFDSAGVDTLDFSGENGAQYIVLRDGHISDVMGSIGNLAIAYDVVIENAIGGTGNDTIKGNFTANVITGGGGDDYLVGGRGDDVVWGGSGNDQLRGDKGDDTLEGGSGNDVLRGGLGTDTMTGGAGADTFIFRRTKDFSDTTSSDTITDFEDGVDHIKLNGDGTAYTMADVAITDLGGGNFDVTVDSSHVIHVAADAGSVLDANDFIFV